MMKTSLIAAMLLLGTASPGLAQQGPSVPQEQAHAAQAGSERVNLVIVYGDDPCPQSQGSDIVVCARKGEEERYRIPEPLRGDPNQPRPQAWGERVRSMEYVGRSGRSEGRRVGKEGVGTCRSRGSPYHSKKKN